MSIDKVLYTGLRARPSIGNDLVKYWKTIEECFESRSPDWDAGRIALDALESIDKFVMGEWREAVERFRKDNTSRDGDETISAPSESATSNDSGSVSPRTVRGPRGFRHVPNNARSSAGVTEEKTVRISKEGDEDGE